MLPRPRPRRSARPRTLARLLALAPLALAIPPLGLAAGGLEPAPPPPPPPPTVEFTTAAQSAPESAGILTATLQLSALSGVDVSVPFTVGGTASDPDDFGIDPSPVVIPAGSLTADIVITLVDDPLDEAAETIVLALGAPTNATLGATTVHSVTVDDDDPAPTADFQLAQQTVGENAGAVAIVVSLSAASGLDVQVPYVHFGTATHTMDYLIDPSPLVIPAGQTAGTIVLTVLDDVEDEAFFERVTVRMQGPLVNASKGSTFRHRLRIEDDDGVGMRRTVTGLRTSIAQHAFAQTRVGEASSAVTVTLTNTQKIPIQFLGIAFAGAHDEDFRAIPPGPLPLTLNPGDSTTIDLVFSPNENGPRTALARVRQRPVGVPPGQVALSGLALGPTGAEVVVNAGPDEYLDSLSRFWAADYGSQGSSSYVSTAQDIQGTDDDLLYQTARVGPAFGYAFQLPPGEYEVRLHGAEIEHGAAGQRVFDVFLEGALRVDDLDLFQAAGPFGAWTSPPLSVTVVDGLLEIDLVRVVGEALIAAIEVRSVPVLQLDSSVLDFGVVDQGATEERVLTITNVGLHQGTARQLAFVMDGSSEGSGKDFYVKIGQNTYHGGVSTVFHSILLPFPPGVATPVSVFFEPTEHDHNRLTLEFHGDFDTLEVTLLGTGSADSSWGYLHPVLDHHPPLIVDYDKNGREDVQLLGSESHTHEPGQTIAFWEWKVNGQGISLDADTQYALSLGDSTVELTITDDKIPPDSATDSTTLTVFPADGVPGTLALYYDGAAAGGALALLDNVPSKAQFIERIADLRAEASDGTVGSSPFDSEVMVRWQAIFDVTQTTTYEFLAAGGADRRLEIDSLPYPGSMTLSAGTHTLEARFAIQNLGELPASLTVLVNGQVDPGFASTLRHDENGIVPVIHEMPSVGAETGGNLIMIQGFGYYPKQQVTVHWGAVDFTDKDFLTWSGEVLELTSPPGTGTIQVTVETPAGVSDPELFTYSPDGPVPIKFILLSSKALSIPEPTTATWHPGGKLFIGSLDGRIAEVAFDETWSLKPPGIVWHTGVSNLTNSDLLGIAVNPYDPPDPVKLYVAHGEHWLNGGGSFQGPSPFTGQISVLTGPNFDNPVPLITGLPTSNHDHGINGLVFDNNGDLLACVGGNTNAGVKWPLIGDLPESPFSGSIIEAQTSRPDFDGTITYLDRATGVPVADQVFGESIDPAPGLHVSVWASGLRNAYDLVLTTSGYVYAADNGPNFNYGPASTGPTTDTGYHVETDDEIMLVEAGEYYGHANRSRGFDDPRQYLWRGVVEPSDLDFTQRIWPVESATCGMEEYRAQTFKSQIRGRLLAQKWNGNQILMELTGDGHGVVDDMLITPFAKGLDVVQGPGGTILAIDYSGYKVQILEPDDAAAVGLTLYDIFPWRAPSTGGTPFLLGGEGFAAGQTTVTIGGQVATLTAVSARRIEGLLPPLAQNNIGSLHDVQVTVGVDTVVLPGAFLALPPVPGQMKGFWTAGANLPDALGEVAGAVVGRTLYLFGEGPRKTYAYDLITGIWRDDLASRPLPGNHHACEAVGGKVVLFGGLGSGSEGQVQIYDPASDTWSLGAPMPWPGGSCSSAVIGSQVLVCGGIVGTSTVDDLSVYDPATDSWDGGGTLSLAPMPVGVNHAAAATDGARLYVFGGRQGGNWPQDGFDTLQVYDPGTDTWDSSSQPQSSLAPMPQGRGGTGKAVFFEGRFMVFGGESTTNVFDDVFVYDPAGNGWSSEEPLPTARHGIYPVVFRSRVLVAGGGTSSGFSASDVLEIFRRP